MESQSAALRFEPASGVYAFLFSDITDSTKLWLADPEAMSEALAMHDEVMRKLLADTGGLLFTTAGDSFHSAYIEPLAALRAALQARHVLRDLSWGRTGPLRDRYALHVGWAEWRMSDFFGPEVIHCARLLDVAQPDQVVLSPAFAEAVTGTKLASFVDLGNHELRGFDRPSRVFAVEL